MWIKKFLSANIINAYPQNVDNLPFFFNPSLKDVGIKMSTLVRGRENSPSNLPKGNSLLTEVR